MVGVLTGGEADSRITRLFMSDFSLLNVYLTTSRFFPQGTSEPIISWTCLSIILAERIWAALSYFLKILLPFFRLCAAASSPALLCCSERGVAKLLRSGLARAVSNIQSMAEPELKAAHQIARGRWRF